MKTTVIQCANIAPENLLDDEIRIHENNMN